MPTKTTAPAKRAVRKTGSSALPVKVVSDEVVAASGLRKSPDKASTAPRHATPKVSKDTSLKAQILEVLKDSLRIKVDDGGFTDPNTRIIEVFFDGKRVCREAFSISERSEYGG